MHTLTRLIPALFLMLAVVKPSAGQDVTTSSSQASAVSEKDRVQKIGEAAVQFDVPKGWTLETKPDAVAGDAYRLISPDGGATIAFIPCYESDMDERLTAIRDAIETHSKSFKAGEEKTETVNGITCTVRADNVDNGETVAVTGTIRAKKPVIFIRSGDKAAMQTNAATLDRIFHSIKATE